MLRIGRSCFAFQSSRKIGRAGRSRQVFLAYSILLQNTDRRLVQWWNSFIFAVFGAAILIGSRKYLALPAVSRSLTPKKLQQFAAGLQTTRPIGPYPFIPVFSSLVQLLYFSVSPNQAGFYFSVDFCKDSPQLSPTQWGWPYSWIL